MGSTAGLALGPLCSPSRDPAVPAPWGAEMFSPCCVLKAWPRFNPSTQQCSGALRGPAAAFPGALSCLVRLAKAPGCPDMPAHTFVLRFVCLMTVLKALVWAGSVSCPACQGLGLAAVSWQLPPHHPPAFLHPRAGGSGWGQAPAAGLMAKTQTRGGSGSQISGFWGAEVSCGKPEVERGAALPLQPQLANTDPAEEILRFP